MKRLMCIIMISICLSCQSVSAMNLTSVTVDAENANGETLNAPGGVFSTNLGDPAPQIGVRSSAGVWLNTRWSGGNLGEVSIPLKTGINTFDLFGSTSYVAYDYYGLVLFFDGIVTPPQIAVFNSNGGTQDFQVQPAGTPIISSANGGLWFDAAPGTAVYRSADGSSVEVVEFKITRTANYPDIVGWGKSAPDGFPDIIGRLTLNFTPAPNVTISEYTIPTPSSSPLDLVVDPSGNVWFTERYGNNIGKCTPAGVITEYPVGPEPLGIAYDRFKNMVYFSGGDYGNGYYGLLKPSTGVVTKYPTGLPVASATDCTFLPNGKFWFNGWDSRSISRADSSGFIQSFLPPSFGYMSGLSEDPEGNLWLTIVDAYEYNPRLLKLDTKASSPGTSNGFTEMPFPPAQATIRTPLAAMGKIWFPVIDQSMIASYDPVTGEFREYPTPTPNAGVHRLAVDRWDRIWFAEKDANQIGMLDLRTGSITEFSIPTPNSEPNDVAIDLDKDIVYFTEGAGNKIGKLTLRP